MDTQGYALRMVDIHKSFNNGQIKANVGINLNVKKNEIHAIIGENGAGKSTLMSILFGLYKQDKGQIFIWDQEVNFKSSKDASKSRIGMVHQHFKLIDNFKVIDNIILGTETTKFGIIRYKQCVKKLESLIKEYNFKIDLNAKVSSLTVGEQQKVEILKVLYRDADLLIFDEPTAVLSDNEIESFLDILREFKSKNKTILIITHKLHEIKAVADSATVIRKGQYIGSVDVKTTSIEEMAELMVGRTITPSINNLPVTNDEVVLSVKDLNLNSKTAEEKYDELLNKSSNFVKTTVTKGLTKAKEVVKKLSQSSNLKSNISFEIKKGEIFAIAGVEGNGQSKLIEIISGLKKTEAKKIFFRDNDKLVDISKMSLKKRVNLGISFVPEDRHKHGLTLDQSVRINSVNNLIDKKPFSANGLIVPFEIATYAQDIIDKFDVRGTANGTANTRALSGGNQQKLIIGREMTKKHELLILAQPTRGLDVGAIEYIHGQIIEAKKRGKAILLVSYELDEIMALADTIAVINRNSFIGVGSKEEMTRSKIGQLLAGEAINESI
ncbi:ABC transporter ATP-binding protein [Mycoplasma bradburyae]|uniref:ABC transporter ATP-binding protein n=1 Tax=Mycoplasma bradburyae TaxID=2963128 RepID=UPI0020CC731E|nr:ABC transporter ATP-binding protein [Mycoplasma bradburyae]UTS70985.1 ABC transporter ATP-binding protein [Mycoplasma bradburyae]